MILGFTSSSRASSLIRIFFIEDNGVTHNGRAFQARLAPRIRHRLLTQHAWQIHPIISTDYRIRFILLRIWPTSGGNFVHVRASLPGIRGTAPIRLLFHGGLLGLH